MSYRSRIKQVIWLLARFPPARRALVAYFEAVNARDGGWKRTHPFDRDHGVQTSGMLPGYVLQPGDPLDRPSTAYAAAQPSIIRAALATIPHPQRCQFFDLGCGKGRPLLIATEFGFAGVTGVELSPELATVARRNAAVFARAYADRPRIHIVNGDATAHCFPAEPLVIFLYNSFGRPLVAQLLVSLEATLRASPRDLYFVYYNPTWAELLDDSPAFERRYAAHLPYDASELGYGSETSDSVVVWQNRGNAHPRPPGDANAPITVLRTGWRAEVPETATPA